MTQRIKILIACHKPCSVPAESCYLPVEVGAALHAEPIRGFMRDDMGENISHKKIKLL